MVMVESTMMRLGTKAPDFELPDTDGVVVSRSDFDGQPLLVAFWCNHCPFVKHIADKFAKMATQWQDQDVAVVAIMSNDVANYPDDSPAKMATEIRRRSFTFPYLYDETQAVAKAYGAACTPDFFLFNAHHKLFYRGQFDETRPDKGTPSGKDLDAAIQCLLSGQPAPEKQYPSAGCNIKWKKGAEPAYFRA